MNTIRVTNWMRTQGYLSRERRGGLEAWGAERGCEVLGDPAWCEGLNLY